MSDLSLGKLIVPTLLTTGAVFTALSAPVVLFAETPVQVTQGKTQLHNGPLRDAAAPYLMLAAVTSVGLGISGVAVAGWRKSSKRADQLSDQVDNQYQRRLDREAHLEATLSSESYLEKSGLNFFLEDGELTPFEPETLAVEPQVLPVASSLPIAAVAEPRLPVAAPVAPPVAPQSPLPLEEQDMAAQLAWLDGEDLSAPVQPQPVRQPVRQQPAAPQPSVRQQPARPVVAPAPMVASRPQPAPAQPEPVRHAPMTAAQGFYGFTRTSPGHPAGGAQDTMTIARIQSLQSQLQEIVTQIESLQANLPVVNAAIQVVAEVPTAQSGLVQQAFHSQPMVESRNDTVQHIRRVAS